MLRARLILGSAPTPMLISRLMNLFSECRIYNKRVKFQRRLDFREYLAPHHQFDFGLDPLSYNGGTTIMHSFWMGVPVITPAVKTIPSLTGVANLSHVGF